MFPDLKTILQSYSDKISLALAQNSIYIRNRIKSSEINLHTYSQVNYDKGGKNIQWRKDNLFNKLCLMGPSVAIAPDKWIDYGLPSQL